MQTNLQQEFDIIYSQAENLLKTFPEYQFKTITAMIIVIGWLLTAETAQIFIRANADIVVPATAVTFTVLAVFKILWIKLHVGKIQLSYLRLKVLAEKLGLSDDSIDIFNIGSVITYTYFVINTLMSVAVFVTVYLICG
jgi:hypothetical protein